MKAQAPGWNPVWTLCCILSFSLFSYPRPLFCKLMSLVMGLDSWRVEMMVLFTIVQNRKKLRYTKEAYVGGKRIKQISATPRKAMMGKERWGRGWAGRVFMMVLGNEKWQRRGCAVTGTLAELWGPLTCRPYLNSEALLPGPPGSDPG